MVPYRAFSTKISHSQGLGFLYCAFWYRIMHVSSSTLEKKVNRKLSVRDFSLLPKKV